MRKGGHFIGILVLLLLHHGLLAQDGSLGRLPKDSSQVYSRSLSERDFEDSIKRALDDLLAPRKSYWEGGVNYLSNNVYLGRKDTVLTPYINATFGYYHKSGLYLDVTASLLPNASPVRLDLFTLEAGYSFKSGDFSAQFLVDKYFFNSQSNNVKADVKETFGLSLSYDLGFIKPELTPSLVVSNNFDFMLLMGVEHSFYFDEDAFELTPNFSANGSTQNYYSAYYLNRKYKVKKKKVVVALEKEKIYGVVENASRFKILDYEIKLPLDYVYHKWGFNFTPTYAIPVHPAVVDITTQIGSNPPKTKTRTELISNSFYWQLGLTLKL